MKKKIELNEQFVNALNRLNTTNKSLFITGKAGTGKSTLLTHFQKETSRKVVILAPTGVSALNVQGQTIHSFFGFPPSITPEKVRREKASNTLLEILKHLDVIVIDEVSMVRADLMDCIDEALRLFLHTSEPFGGVQMVFIGDLHQLPPVVAGEEERQLFRTEYASPYFFDAKVFGNTQFDFLELVKIYRQKDQEFIKLLNKVRNNKISALDLDKLNARVLPDPQTFHNKDHSYITLTSTNDAANEINNLRLERLPSSTESYEATLSGEFEGRNHPTLAQLKVKKGAQIMMLNNDKEGRWVNGSIGKIISIEFDDFSGEDVLHIQLEGAKKIVKVEPYTWELHKYSWNSEKSEMETDTIGSFRQYPVRLAWAVTIHKSQGKTFDKVVVDIGKGAFTHGQVYVALSRCRSMKGLLLQRPIQSRHIWSNRRIDMFHAKISGDL
ncbi:MAG: DEAD/DEAH box helicase [Patescibacteria group bacterium]